ncbi:hypothetical protein [Leptospira santarosai]|uniref:Uncharacterized protein n=1 Tax=Leptospira santarosai serovar Shermani str. LT 821 TaxID=758847 RepID=K8Y679_9LEPT|nr:hypothetical protein [Leptospira santarosai]EKT85305.1 hypothetical protein LSS_18289 [Leptospira santarosai serovar Shermani str. LT 821]EPG83367.1 hypothetical protein LEP1GSC048_1059 [Leptospira santarosai serovar Shermani str. 1342KT]
MYDELDFKNDMEDALRRSYAVADESGRIGNVTLAVTLERVATLPNNYVIGFKERVNGLDLKVEENHLSIQLNYSRFMEGLTLPTDSAESWNEFRSKLYESLKVAGVRLQSFHWLEVIEITFYRRIILEENFATYFQLIRLMNLYGRAVEFQNGYFAFVSKLFFLKISPVTEHFESDFNIHESSISYEPEQALLLEFTLNDREAFLEIFNKSIYFQELKSKNVVQFFSNASKNLSESIKHLASDDRFFKFVENLLSFNKAEDKAAFNEELNKALQLLRIGDRKMNELSSGNTFQKQVDTFCSSFFEVREALFGNQSPPETLGLSLKMKNRLVQELCAKLDQEVYLVPF